MIPKGPCLILSIVKWGGDTTSINEIRNRLFFFMIDLFIFKLQLYNKKVFCDYV